MPLADRLPYRIQSLQAIESDLAVKLAQVRTQLKSLMDFEQRLTNMTPADRQAIDLILAKEKE